MNCAPTKKKNMKKTNGHAAEKTLRITCTGAGTAALDDLRPLQGDLKSLSDENYEKLKRSILEHGFSFPFFVWKNKGKLFVLDGHQRDKVLPRLRAEGYAIPPLPVAYIEAANEKEARKKILLLTSEYGHMTDESLVQFLKDSDLTLADLTGTVALPAVDIEALLAAVDGELAPRVTLADRFLIPPFSVLDARQGYWQDRKRAWLALGIQSELGRGAGLLNFSEQATIGHGGKKPPAKSYQNQKRGRKSGTNAAAAENS